MSDDVEYERFPAPVLEHFVRAALCAAGSAAPQATAVAQALGAASLRGVDSHGVRLLPHYVRALIGGRVASTPELRVEQTLPAAAIVDADDGFGHYASFRAVAEGCAMARECGTAAVSVVNSSHFGAAGCYVLDAAKQGFVAFAFTNSDSFVLPHAGRHPFHGTNPIAFAAPVGVGDERPYLLDMATSIVPWNRIQDYHGKGMPVPEDVAVDSAGQVTTDPAAVAALLPLGGERFGFKGAGLASMVEVLSAVMTGMAHCSRLLPMGGTDMSTPRRLGHFFIVLNPEAFVPRQAYERGMAAYLSDLRAGAANWPEQQVMAPGDREWVCFDKRKASGIPIAPALLDEYAEIAELLGLDEFRRRKQ